MSTIQCFHPSQTVGVAMNSQQTQNLIKGESLSFAKYMNDCTNGAPERSISIIHCWPIRRRL